MTDLALNKYDDWRDWIKKSRKNKRSWDAIKYGGKEDEAGLKDFLHWQVTENYFCEIDPETWYELVQSEKSSEEESLAT